MTLLIVGFTVRGPAITSITLLAYNLQMPSAVVDALLRLSLSLARTTLVATFSISSPRQALGTAGGPGMALLPKHTMIHPSFLTLTPILAKRYPFPPTIYQQGSSRRSCWQNANTRPRSLPSTLTRTSDFSLHCAVASGAPPIMGRASASAKTFRCPIRCRERDRAAGPSLTSPGPLASDYNGVAFSLSLVVEPALSG